MKSRILALVVGLLFLGALVFARKEGGSGVRITSEKQNPWTSLKFNTHPDEFQFAIVSDRTGGHREKVFSRAVEKLNLLQPEFVLSVGDLIEGGKQKQEKIDAEWKEFDTYVKRLKMPFFYVPGNHDVGTPDNDKTWQERYGRRDYSFVYRNVLFLCLNTEDPPGAGVPQISKEQVARAKEALEANKDVRWTIVAMHKPIWTANNLEKRGWIEIEQALASRPYTVFVGHVHKYRKFVRQGRDYYQLATTGGGSKLRGVEYGEFDHIVWVTMKKDGPVLANVVLDSVYDDEMKMPESSEKGVNRTIQKTKPIRITVYYDGSPAVGAFVSLIPPEGRKGAGADGFTEGDGSFIPSTYKAKDGVVPGKYSVVVTQRKPMLNADGSAGPNHLPEKYANAKTSGLTIEVGPETEEIRFDLTK